MKINTDSATTVLGLLSGGSALAYQYGIAPQYTGTATALLTALLGFFTNKAK